MHIIICNIIALLYENHFLLLLLWIIIAVIVVVVIMMIIILIISSVCGRKQYEIIVHHISLWKQYNNFSTVSPLYIHILLSDVILKNKQQATNLH